eukprot:3588680-Pyramimonas_sp.AAC.1
MEYESTTGNYIGAWITGILVCSGVWNAFSGGVFKKLKEGESWESLIDDIIALLAIFRLRDKRGHTNADDILSLIVSRSFLGLIPQLMLASTIELTLSDARVIIQVTLLSCTSISRGNHKTLLNLRDTIQEKNAKKKRADEASAREA